MSLGCYNGGAVVAERPYQELLQRWRLSLASLLFFTILLSNQDLGNVFAWRTCSSTSIPEYFVPLPCNNNLGIDEQCFHLTGEFVDDLCNITAECRTKQRDIRLPFCTSIPFSNLFADSSENCLSLSQPEECRTCLHNILANDTSVKMIFQDFTDIIGRYDCDHGFSDIFGCDDCLIAYKEWICATEFRFYENGELIRPCFETCGKVAARCPYLLPNITYTGLPTFVCPGVRNIKFNDIYDSPPSCFACVSNSEQGNTSSERVSKRADVCTFEVMNSTNSSSSVFSSSVCCHGHQLLALLCIIFWTVLYSHNNGYT
ncbi:NALCN channel auxiliary factor 1-like [Ptychodera flava]|uniref:NALCN channel auxiliary factor 1-like n=1 Tax=Ptychodera flava TaxID=63121 RepID=UPI00396A12E2